MRDYNQETDRPALLDFLRRTSGPVIYNASVFLARRGVLWPFGPSPFCPEFWAIVDEAEERKQAGVAQ